MFNVTGSEILILLVLALVVVGPERLPEVARKFAKSYGELKKMSTGFQTELRDALDEPLREMRSTADQLRKTIEDPINETVKSGTDAVKGNISGDVVEATSTPGDATPAIVDPVVAADSPVFADATATSTDAAATDAAAGSAAAPGEPSALATRPTSPFDRAVSSAAPKKNLSAAAAADVFAAPAGAMAPPPAATLLPPPSGLSLVAPPSATATAFLAPPTVGDAADPSTAPETPSA